ncbi:MAG TPA: 2-C-methyl-D-erythritol 4-phosphate cytidylyltransferase, partial [Burkholderiales bacterium]|nr:2-C-methyl-D-erythritol 4-phosphate cytidylyltransferase [Burkholderiales bacterium]
MRYALVPAAGSGSRMGGVIPKQYAALCGRPMIYHALESLCNFPEIAAVYVVLAENDVYWEGCDWSALGGKLAVLRCGGDTRLYSVLNGLKAIDAAGEDWILVHDAARPCIDHESLERLVEGTGDDVAGGLLALPVADTLKREDGNGRVESTVSRNGLWAAQTPQMFRRGLLMDALRRAPSDQTDEAGAVEAFGYSPKLILGVPRNFKVTYPGDMIFAEA